MANRDINLFKAAGGDRAKGSKTSPLTYMVIFALVVLVAAVGVVAYFNMQANSAAQELEKKQAILESYEQTRMILTRSSGGNKSLAERYNDAKANLETAQAIDKVIANISALYPQATQTEVTAVQSVLESNNLSVTPTKPFDYETIRTGMYNVMNGATPDSDDYKNRSTFYYALGELAEAQKTGAENVWFGYYRCYAVIACLGWANEDVAEGLVTMEGSPFMRLQVNLADDPLNDAAYETYLASTLYTSYTDDTNTTYSVILVPMKSVIERVYDALESCARSLMDTADSDLEREKYYYAVTDLIFSNEGLVFDLILDNRSVNTKDRFWIKYAEALESSPFFTVLNNTDDSTVAVQDGEYCRYKFYLSYSGIATAESRNR